MITHPSCPGPTQHGFRGLGHASLGGQNVQFKHGIRLTEANLMPQAYAWHARANLVPSRTSCVYLPAAFRPSDLRREKELGRIRRHDWATCPQTISNSPQCSHRLAPFGALRERSSPESAQRRTSEPLSLGGRWAIKRAGIRRCSAVGRARCVLD